MWIRQMTDWLLQIMLVISIWLPAMQTASAGVSIWSKPAPIADTVSDPSPEAWHNWVQVSSNWVQWPASGSAASPVLVPKDNFHLLGQGRFMPGATGGLNVSEEMYTGDKWITLAQETIGTAGISSQNITDAMRHFPGNAAYVFAEYSPENATGRIVVQRIEKSPSGQIRVWQADFTPWSGQLWAAQGKYRSAAEISSGAAGNNPFAAFEGSVQDPLFHHLSWGAMMVATGHAMRHYGAVLAFIAVDKPSVNQVSSSSSSLFSNSVTTTVSGYVQPEWFVATPMEATPAGQTAQICVTGGTGATTASCDDPAHVATAGVMVSAWQGGNMPSGQDLVYQYTNSQSGWNVLFFTVLFSIVTWGVASVLDAGLIAAGNTGLIASAGGDAAFLGGMAGGYAMASTVFGSGGSLLQTQSGLFGSTGNGWASQMVPQSAVQAGIMNAVEANHIATPMGNGGLNATDRLYLGGCGAGFTVAQCRQMNLDPGTIWRPDSYAEYNSTKAMRQRYQTCIASVAEGGLGLQPGSVAAEQCAAPAAGIIQQ